MDGRNVSAQFSSHYDVSKGSLRGEAAAAATVPVCVAPWFGCTTEAVFFVSRWKIRAEAVIHGGKRGGRFFWGREGSTHLLQPHLTDRKLSYRSLSRFDLNKATRSQRVSTFIITILKYSDTFVTYDWMFGPRVIIRNRSPSPESFLTPSASNSHLIY